jgi:hypothetical protein
MADYIGLIDQDIEVAINYVKKKNFENVNVIGNRVLQNFFALDNKEMIIIGLILKEMSNDLQTVNSIGKSKSKSLPTCQNFAQEALNSIKESLSEYNSSKIWDDYIFFKENVRKYLLSVEERDVYVVNDQFSTLAIKKYLDILLENKELLLNRNIAPLSVTRVEIGTLFNTHGGTVTVLVYTCIRAFEHVYKFALHGKIKDDSFNELLSTMCTNIEILIGLIKEGNEDKLKNHSNMVVGELMYTYRKYFVSFGELSGELSENIPVSPEAAQKIRRIVEKNKKK